MVIDPSPPRALPLKGRENTVKALRDVGCGTTGKTLDVARCRSGGSKQVRFGGAPSSPRRTPSFPFKGKVGMGMGFTAN